MKIRNFLLSVGLQVFAVFNMAAQSYGQPFQLKETQNVSVALDKGANNGNWSSDVHPVILTPVSNGLLLTSVEIHSGKRSLSFSLIGRDDFALKKKSRLNIPALHFKVVKNGNDFVLIDRTQWSQFTAYWLQLRGGRVTVQKKRSLQIAPLLKNPIFFQDFGATLHNGQLWICVSESYDLRSAAEKRKRVFPEFTDCAVKLCWLKESKEGLVRLSSLTLQPPPQSGSPLNMEATKGGLLLTTIGRRCIGFEASKNRVSFHFPELETNLIYTSLSLNSLNQQVGLSYFDSAANRVGFSVFSLQDKALIASYSRKLGSLKPTHFQSQFDRGTYLTSHTNYVVKKKQNGQSERNYSAYKMHSLWIQRLALVK
jgi:hypothetical protein